VTTEETEDESSAAAREAAEDLVQEVRIARETYEKAIIAEHRAMDALTDAQTRASAAAGEAIRAHNAYQAALRASAGPYAVIPPRPDRRRYRHAGAPSDAFRSLPTAALRAHNIAQAAQRAETQEDI
jgi:hypothetical protein